MGGWILSSWRSAWTIPGPVRRYWGRSAAFRRGDPCRVRLMVRANTIRPQRSARQTPLRRPRHRPPGQVRRRLNRVEPLSPGVSSAHSGRFLLFNFGLISPARVRKALVAVSLCGGCSSPWPRFSFTLRRRAPCLPSASRPERPRVYPQSLQPLAGTGPLSLHLELALLGALALPRHAPDNSSRLISLGPARSMGPYLSCVPFATRRRSATYRVRTRPTRGP